jgi:hypothetical protein
MVNKTAILSLNRKRWRAGRDLILRSARDFTRIFSLILAYKELVAMRTQKSSPQAAIV